MPGGRGQSGRRGCWCDLVGRVSLVGRGCWYDQVGDGVGLMGEGAGVIQWESVGLVGEGVGVIQWETVWVWWERVLV